MVLKRESACSDTKVTLLWCLPETQKRGSVLARVPEGTEGGSFVERASSRCMEGHPRIQKVLSVDCRPRPGLPEHLVIATETSSTSLGEALGWRPQAHYDLCLGRPEGQACPPPPF